MKQSHILPCFGHFRYSISILLLFFLQISYSQSYKQDTTRLNAIVAEMENMLPSKPDSAKLLIEEAKAIIKPSKEYSSYREKVQLFSGQYFLVLEKPQQALAELEQIQQDLTTCDKESRYFIRDWLTAINKSYLMIGDTTKAFTVFEDIAGNYLEDANAACYATVYSELCYAYRVSNQLDKAIEYGEKAAELGEKYDDYSALIGYLILQNTYFLKQDYINASNYAEKQLEIAERMNDEPEIARAKLNLGSIYGSANQEDAAIKYYFQILPYFEKKEDYQRAGKVANNIAILFKNQKNYDEAIEYIKKAIDYTKESHLEYNHSLSLRYNVLGVLYRNISDYNLAQNAFETALSYCEKSKIQREKGNILINMAHNYELQEDNQTARRYYEEAITHLRGAERPIDLSDAYTKYGDFLVKTGKHNEAIPYLEDAIAIAEENDIPKTQANAYIFLSDAYRQNGQYQRAYTNLEKYSEISEKLKEEEEMVMLERANMKYEFNKERLEKDMEIQALSLNNEKKKGKIRTITFLLLLLALLSALGLLLAGFFKYRNNKERAITKIMATQNEVLKDKNAKILEQKETLLTMNDAIQENNNKLNAELKSKLLLISQQKIMTEKLEKAVNSPTRESKRNLLAIIRSQNNEDIWEKVEDEFLDTHKDFIAIMTRKFPSLTPNNIKTCILIKMGLSNKEIARIRYVEPSSVKVARTRLRKQFGLTNNDITLYSFLNQIVTEDMAMLEEAMEQELS